LRKKIMAKVVKSKKESGAALAIAIIVVAILSVIALTALAFSSSEARIAGSDLQRTQTFYATAASIEKLTNEFSDLFRKKMRPTAADLTALASVQPPELTSEGFTFNQVLTEDTAKLSEMQTLQGLPANVYPRVNIPDGPYSGLYATIVPYKISSTGTYKTGVQVKLDRDFNNYLVPLFQFGIFSNEDIELAPGVQMTFNGRVHSNQNIFALANVKFLSRLTMAGELVRDASTGGSSNTLGGKSNVYMQVSGFNVQIDKGSVESNGTTIGGPNFPIATPGTRGYFPGRPNGVAYTPWDTNSLATADGSPGKFGGRILTGSTGATQLKLPLQMGGSSTAELIKRRLSSDTEILSTSRYHTKAQIRILIDDETAGTGTANAAGIPAGKGVLLSDFYPSSLDGGKALRRVGDSGTYFDTNEFDQEKPGGCSGGHPPATVVRRAKATIDVTPNCTNFSPTGAGLQGRVYIEVVKPDGTTLDVTQTILSMGITVGEPNGILYFQRPLWAAYMQGSRDRGGNALDLVNLTKNYRGGSDGEIDDPSANTDAALGFISLAPGSIVMDRRKTSPSDSWNQIVPINVYNVREGWYRNDLDHTLIYERGMTGVVDVNMRNLARWLDGLYDTNLLSGTTAVSTNIKDEGEGFVVYVSDRRGDKVKTELLPDATSYQSTNGTVDNEDIYGPNNTLDEGEDVIDYGWNSDGTLKKGSLQKDVTELPNTGTSWSVITTRTARANTVMSWSNSSNYFRRAIRLFDAETLSFSAGTNKLSPTKGITIASENMVYTWGNVNTTGITSIPSGGSTLNNGGYTGAQIPMSIVCDALFPLSKTWFDGLSAMYPEGSSSALTAAGTGYRIADAGLGSITQGTSVRAAVIIGSTKGAMSANPGRNSGGQRKNGGINNFPRFLELWNSEGTVRSFNYTGSIIPLYNSTQALSQWENDTSVIYTPPQRNWSFDETYLNPNKLPPGTPFFQYLQATSFRQSIQ
jgi:hypothetical protein